MTLTKKVNWADKLGAISAFVCIIHCLAVPTLMAIGIGFISHPIIAILFILIAFISIYKTTNGKFKTGISIFLWLSFVGFLSSMLLEERAQIFEYTMFFFSATIILGHLYHMRYCLKS